MYNSIKASLNRGLSLNFFFIISLSFFSLKGKTQVDPAWLKSWIEAEEMRPTQLSSVGRLSAKTEPGQAFIIKGSVFKPDHSPAKAVLVHAYHRDAQGYDFGPGDAAHSTWRIQGWAKTDEQGHFEFKTIRPTADHLGREGAHIHFTLVSEQYGRQWAPKVFLGDDPLLTAAQRLRSQQAGKYAWVCSVRKKDGEQYIEVNIRLQEKGDF